MRKIIVLGVVAFFAAIGTGWAQDSEPPTPYCGNGILEMGEQCDSGGTTSYCCNLDCQITPECGCCEPSLQTAGGRNVLACYLTPQGECLGNFFPGSTCQPQGCEPIAVCGNGLVETGEQCDDGGTSNGDCCDYQCHFEKPSSPCFDEGNSCTSDTCDGKGFCSHSLIDPLPKQCGCCDLPPPSASDAINFSQCAITDSKSCRGKFNADAACTPDGCQSAVCGNGIVETGEDCDIYAPGIAYGRTTSDECCNAKTCKFVQAGTACSDDNNVCTDDACDASGVCNHSSNTAPCPDGEFCNGDEVCSDGTCGAGSSPCSGSSTCANVTCNEDTDSCDSTPANDNAPCDDNDACTSNTSCSGGSCAGGSTLNCDDSNTCTTDSCDPVSGCQNPITVETRACNGCLDGIDNDDDDDTDADDSGCATLSESQHFAIIGRLTGKRRSVYLGSQVGVTRADGTIPMSPAPYPLGASRGGVCGEARMELVSGVQIAGALAAADNNRIKVGNGADVNVGSVYVAGPTTTEILKGLVPVIGPGNCSDVGMAPCTQDVDCTFPATCEGLLMTDVGNPNVDRTGTHEEFVRCTESKAAMLADTTYLFGLPVSNPAFDLGTVNYHGAPHPSPFPTLTTAGPHIFHLSRMRVTPGSVLTITSTDPNAVVIVQVAGSISIGKGAQVLTSGFNPANLLWVADGKRPVSINGFSTFHGTILGANRKMKVGQNVTLVGGLIGNRIIVNGPTTLEHRPFTPLL